MNTQKNTNEFTPTSPLTRAQREVLFIHATHGLELINGYGKTYSSYFHMNTIKALQTRGLIEYSHTVVINSDGVAHTRWILTPLAIAWLIQNEDDSFIKIWKKSWSDNLYIQAMSILNPGSIANRYYPCAIYSSDQVIPQNGYIPHNHFNQAQALAQRSGRDYVVFFLGYGSTQGSWEVSSLKDLEERLASLAIHYSVQDIHLIKAPILGGGANEEAPTPGNIAKAECLMAAHKIRLAIAAYCDDVIPGDHGDVRVYLVDDEVRLDAALGFEWAYLYTNDDEAYQTIKKMADLDPSIWLEAHAGETLAIFWDPAE